MAGNAFAAAGTIAGTVDVPEECLRMVSGESVNRLIVEDNEAPKDGD
jgi:hypothetical protein